MDERNSNSEIALVPGAQSLSPQVQHFVERWAYVEQAVNGISQALPPEAEAEQNQLAYIANHVNEMTAVIQQQDLFLQGSAVVVNQLKRDIEELEQQRDDAQNDAENGFDYGYEAGYQQGAEDYGTDAGMYDEEWDDTEDGPRPEPDQRKIEVADLTNRLQRTEERNQALESMLEDVGETAEEHAQRLQEIEAELARKNELLTQAEDMAAQLAEANATIARYQEWYAANFPDQVA